jgi:VWFA-related protein
VIAILSWTIAALLGAPQLPRYVERVDVTRVLVDVRAVDRAGRPLNGLTAADFDVDVDGARARVDSVEWVGAVPSSAAETASVEPPVRVSDREAPGRLIVLLFQKDLEPTRIVGLMRMLIEWQPFLDGFTPRDRIAVLSYDSHLKIWTDFTGDLGVVKQILQHGILFERPPAVAEAEGPSLVAALRPDTARRTYTIERALVRIAAALRPLPGAKSVVLIGHGFGQLTRAGVMMNGEYADARDALIAARASVFSLDVTQADAHSLEAGLQFVSEDTGGFYASTFHFSTLALDRLAGALAGHYALFVKTPRLEPGRHRVNVKLKNRKGEVLATREILVS